MKIDYDALVLVADGGKMLLFRNKGDGDHPDLKVEEATENLNPPDHEQASDAPGRAVTGVGGRKSAYENTNFHDLSEQRFAVDAVDMLNKRALAQDFESLIIIAPPQTLGEMRKHYHKETEARLAGEIGKDLAGHPVPEIEKIISAS